MASASAPACAPMRRRGGHGQSGHGGPRASDDVTVLRLMGMHLGVPLVLLSAPGSAPHTPHCTGSPPGAAPRRSPPAPPHLCALLPQAQQRLVQLLLPALAQRLVLRHLRAQSKQARSKARAATQGAQRARLAQPRKGTGSTTNGAATERAPAPAHARARCMAHAPRTPLRRPPPRPGAAPAHARSRAHAQPRRTCCSRSAMRCAYLASSSARIAASRASKCASSSAVRDCSCASYAACVVVVAVVARGAWGMGAGQRGSSCCSRHHAGAAAAEVCGPPGQGHARPVRRRAHVAARRPARSPHSPHSAPLPLTCSSCCITASCADRSWLVS